DTDLPLELGVPIALLGFRATRGEKEDEEKKINTKIYQLRGSEEELYKSLWRSKVDPLKAVERYNNLIERTLDGSLINRHMKRKDPLITKQDIAQIKKELLVDPKKLLANKMETLTRPSAKPDEIKSSVEYLKRFGINDYNDAKKYLLQYFKNKKIKDFNVKRDRLYRLKKIYSESQ
ncbi:hypothetical protein KKE60_09005, partial [Patescibacteria group bacterium]|nr:hypothetical protein [Patescibacteria group bacterium]